jgi:hypothetical protein
MTKKSDGGTGSGNRTKLAWDALRLMESLGCKTIEEFNEKVAALQQPNLAALAAEAPLTPPEVAAVPDAQVVDCMAWINENVDQVWLVAQSMTLSLRPSKPFMTPPLEQIMISKAHEAEWPNMPFDIRGKTDAETQWNRMRYAHWGHFVVSRDLAEQVYGHQHFPLPDKAVIVPEEFTGWGTYSHAAGGKKRLLVNPDPLRETVRRVLQRFPGRCFINSMRHPLNQWPTPGIANPYGNRLGNLKILRIYDRSDQTPEWDGTREEVSLDVR